MKLETVILGQMQTNCYLLSSDSAAVVIDPGDKSEIVENFLFSAKKCIEVSFLTFPPFESY